MKHPLISSHSNTPKAPHSFTTHPRAMPKLLRDFLLEHQEPFSLNTFLSERGFPRRNRAFEKSICTCFATALFCRLVSRKSDGDNGEIIHTEVDEGSSSNISSSMTENHVSFEATRGESSSSSSSSTSVFQERDISKSCDLYAVNKRVVMHQTEHLLLDCVREVIEKRRKNETRAREWDLHHEGEKEEMYAEIGNAILDGIIDESFS